MAFHTVLLFRLGLADYPGRYLHATLFECSVASLKELSVVYLLVPERQLASSHSPGTHTRRGTPGRIL